MQNKDKNVEKRAKFKRLAEARTNRVLKALDILGNCSNRGSYDYSEKEVHKIFAEIDTAVKNTKAQFYSLKDKKFEL